MWTESLIVDTWRWAKFWIYSEPVATFYGLQAATLLVLWIGVRLGGQGFDYLRFPLANKVALRPSWFPSRVFLKLLNNWIYLPAAYSLIPFMALAAFSPSSLCLRLLVACTVCLYHVAESSRTSSHRDYPMLYNSCALALLPNRYAQAAAFGLTVHFISASGLAKLFVAGPGWVDLRAILQTFGAKEFQAGGPLIPALNRFVVRSRSVATSCGAATLLFECVIAPLAFFTPPTLRLSFCIAMLVLHAGIAVIHSAAIGIFFIPNVASYVFGFSAQFELGSHEWGFAMALWLVLTCSILVRRELLPEDWPLTPLALFPWSGNQWEILHERLVHGETRLVLATDVTHLRGLPVVELNYRTARGEPPPDGPVVYDAWSRLVGITTFQTGVLEALKFDCMEHKDWDATCFAQRVETWLKCGRVLEIETGKPLDLAYFVKVQYFDQSECSNSRKYGVVKEVICSGTPPVQQPLLGNDTSP